MSRPEREGSYGMYASLAGALAPAGTDDEVDEKPSIGLSIGRSSSMLSCSLKLGDSAQAQEGRPGGFTRPGPPLVVTGTPMGPLKPSNGEEAGGDHDAPLYASPLPGCSLTRDGLPFGVVWGKLLP